ncbi:MAG TPA: SDR family NAD(P)-dependent oxidoreductase [Xanthobacteraceae bacterium]|nr:SDR family NAD(P)-dependent oxidoreductase [Xanthobacteraceae bacterium]
MSRLAGRIALVTGAARGIGLAIARRFIADGAKVVLSDVDEKTGREAARALGADAQFISCDVGDAEAVAALVDSAIEKQGAIDILVNNAGIIHTADFLEISEHDFDRVLRVNLKGSFLCGQAAARQMVRQAKAGRKPGAIINMSSINSVVAIPNQVPYSVSKGGVQQLTKVMALSLAPHGIRVNAIGPGSIATEILAGIATDKAAKKRILSRTPLQRIGAADEIAGVASFLASDDASYITGETIFPDGGRLALNYIVDVKDEALE